ncbi:type IV pilus inner membrane component PilO, partial [Desulfothermus sp.]
MKTNELIEKIEKYPRKYRIIAFLVVILLVTTGYWYFIFKPKSEQIKLLEKDIENLNRQIALNRKKAAQIKKLEVKIKDKRKIFYYAKKLLPDSTVEIENLLANIETLGNDVGVEFLLFKP